MTQPRRRPRFRVHALAIGLVVPLLGLLATNASAADTDPQLVTFGLGPSDGTTADGRPFMNYGIAAGSTVYDSVSVLNQSDVPLDLTVYAADAVTSESGDLDLQRRDMANIDVGSWVTFADGTRSKEITVPPQSAETGVGMVILPIVVVVPQNAYPGDHAGGIAAALISKSVNAGAQNLELEQRVNTRMYLRVDGPLEPALDISQVESHYERGSRPFAAGSVTVSYVVTNTGNVRMGLDGAVEVSGPFGLLSRRENAETVPQLLPGASGRVEVTVAGVYPLGLLSSSITVRPIAAPGVEAPDLGPTVITDRLVALTWEGWLLLALLVVVILLLVVRGVRRRRARRPNRPAPRPDALVSV